jgi:hypothetical protein
MQTARRPLRRAYLVLALISFVAFPVFAAERSRIKAEDYQIDAEIFPQTHQLTARAHVKFTVLADTNFGSFELNNGLRVTKVLDSSGKPLSAERISQDNVVRVAFPNGLAKGSTGTLTFDY